jgi:uncharacterized protein YndB with AHSA1/START domain
MAIYEIAAVTTIAVPPEYVWAVLDDFSGWPAWMPAMQDIRIELLSSGEPCVGYSFRVRGKVVHADLRVEVYDPLERLTSFRLSFPPITGDNRCSLIPLDDGRYRMERIDHIHLPGKFIDFLNATQRKRFEQLAAEFLTALKHEAERRLHESSLSSTC